MKIIPCEQNSLEWLVARAGVPTASEWDALISPTWEIRKGQMPTTYLAQKVAESWLQGPLPGFMSLDMEYGKIREEEAIPRYEFDFSETVQRVGFVTTDDGRLGCSPDGLIADDGGIEIKCPEAKTHVGYLLNGEVPTQYLAQIHGSMMVTGRAWWKFFSYRRRFPTLVKLVERDDKIQAIIKEALEGFLVKFDKAMTKLEEINGGPRPQKPKLTPKPEAPEMDFDTN